MHILVVDDDIPTVEVIRTSLHWDLLGIDRVETAYDYTEAQNKICASQPDIILCDIEMPPRQRSGPAALAAGRKT